MESWRHPVLCRATDDKEAKEVVRQGLSDETAKTATVEISHPEKVFWPDEGYTKQDLADFYQEVFPLLRTYVADRFLTMSDAQWPPWHASIRRKSLQACARHPYKTNPEYKRTTQIDNYVSGGSLKTQIALVNLGCIPVHVTGSARRPFSKT